MALGNGEISGIVESPYGYHIIMRLPLNPDDFRDSYIVQAMSDLYNTWLSESEPETTEAYSQIDPSAFYAKMQSLKAGVQEELKAQQSA